MLHASYTGPLVLQELEARVASLASAAALHAHHDQLQQQAQLELIRMQAQLQEAVKVSPAEDGWLSVPHVCPARRLCLSIIESRCCAGHACPCDACIAARPAPS